MFLLLLPPIWLLIVIVGLPQLSETVYTPSLPEIAKALQTTVGMVENTLTIYLFAFAIGTLFWGRISDTYGRRHCVIMGLLIFIKGCISVICQQLLQNFFAEDSSKHSEAVLEAF